jgi:hypothetical protein
MQATGAKDQWHFEISYRVDDQAGINQYLAIIESQGGYFDPWVYGVKFVKVSEYGKFTVLIVNPEHLQADRHPPHKKGIQVSN